MMYENDLAEESAQAPLAARASPGWPPLRAATSTGSQTGENGGA